MLAWLIARVVTARLVSSILLPDLKLVLIVPSFLSLDCTALDEQSIRVDAVRRQVMSCMTCPWAGLPSWQWPDGIQICVRVEQWPEGLSHDTPGPLQVEALYL